MSERLMTGKRSRAPKTSTSVRQEQIVHAALELVGRHGLKALTVTAIARQVGVVPSAIYRHFPGKGAIVDAILGLIRQRLQANADAVCAHTKDARERLRLLHQRHVELIRRNMGIPRLVFSEDVYGDDPHRRQQLYGVVQAYRKRVAEIVEQGQKDGMLRADVAPQAAALMFLGLIQPAAFLWHISDGSFDVTSETERCWRLFSDAMRPDRHPVVPE